jgi:hypothetical protein
MGIGRVVHDEVGDDPDAAHRSAANSSTPFVASIELQTYPPATQLNLARVSRSH